MRNDSAVMIINIQISKMLQSHGTALSPKWCVSSQTAYRGKRPGLSVILGPTRVWHQFGTSGCWDRGTYDAVVLFTSCKIMLNRSSYMWNADKASGLYFRGVRKWVTSHPPHEEFKATEWDGIVGTLLIHFWLLSNVFCLCTIVYFFPPQPQLAVTRA